MNILRCQRFNIQYIRGFTLVELMIAMLIGVLLVGAVIFIFIQNKASSQKNANMIYMQDNARYALNILSYDLAHAGFYGGVLYGQYVDRDGTLPKNLTADCGASTASTVTSAWLYNLEVDLEIYNQTDLKPAKHSCIEDLYTGFDSKGTETLAIRSVITNPIAIGANESNRLYLRTNKIQACLWYSSASAPTVGGSCPTGVNTEDWELVSNIYYIVNASAVPTLYRKKIVGAAMTSEPLIDNVERFHIDFGIDSGEDDIVDSYVSVPSSTSNVISARIYVLVRSERPVQEYTSNKTYNLGTLAPINDPNDGYYRRVYSTTVLLRNIANLRGL